MLDDLSPMPWGKHKGKSMEDVPASYLLWCYENEKTCPQVKAYIAENMLVIQAERKLQLLTHSIRNNQP